MSKFVALSEKLLDLGFGDGTMINQDGIRSLVYFSDGSDLYAGWQSKPGFPILRQALWGEAVPYGSIIRISDSFKRLPATKPLSGLTNRVFNFFINQATDTKLEFQKSIQKIESGIIKQGTVDDVHSFDFQQDYRLIKIYYESGTAVLCKDDDYKKGISVDDFQDRPTDLTLLHVNFLLYPDFIYVK